MLNLLLFLFGLSATLHFSNVQAALEGEGIIGGDDALPGDYPYQISLEVGGRSICGGSLISSYHAITAAHCVADTAGRLFVRATKVVAGISDLRTNPAGRISIDVDKVYIPKLYDPKNFNQHMIGDIAVLRLKQSVDFEDNPYVGKLKLPTAGKSYAGERVVITGFGWNEITTKKPWNGGIKETGGSRIGKLRWAETDVITKDECQKGYRSPVLDSHICAKLVQRTSTPEGICTGDSGGPLVYNGDTLIGVVSTSPLGCREDEDAAVYTRVTYYLDFVKKAVNDVYDSNIKTRLLWDSR